MNKIMGTNHIKYKVDKEGVAFVTWDVFHLSVNIMNEDTLTEFFSIIKKAIDDVKVIGIVINSAKKDFISGGDLKWFLTYDKSKKECFQMLMDTHRNMRLMETCKKPLVAAINGVALGGGCEIALACHHRIMSKHPKNRMGLVECSVGLFPGAGGTQRFLRMLGPQKTIQYITQAKKLTAEQALKDGLVDEICGEEEDINALAKQWILNNPIVEQPWDVKRFKVSGTPVGIGQLAGVNEFFSVSNALAYKKTNGNLPHIKNVLSAIYHGACCTIDQGLEIEARYFVDTLFSKETKNIIRASFLFIKDASKGKSKPQGYNKTYFNKVGIIGAGMMGASIAYVNAKVGLDVVLKDVSLAKAEMGKDYVQIQEHKRLKSRRTSQVKIDELLQRIKPSDSVNELADCDLIIEAVFENEKLKNKITEQVEAVIEKEIIYATNTSTIPITNLAKASSKPDKFIGLHFFSPVEKMALVEVIVGENTSNETIAKAIDYVTQLKKVPIIVNDGRGFFTSRVFAKFVNEGISMLTEGVPPAVIENVAKKIGMPVGPLAISDEVNLKLMVDIMNEDPNLTQHEIKLKNIMHEIIEKHGRIGKKQGKGFYDYPINGKKTIWKGWSKLYPPQSDFDEEEIGKRLLFSMVIDAYKCLDSGVIREPTDADIGSILGLGFPIYTGGVISYIDYIGAKKFANYSKKLEQKYGERFNLPDSLKVSIQKAGRNRIFYNN